MLAALLAVSQHHIEAKCQPPADLKCWGESERRWGCKRAHWPMRSTANGSILPTGVPQMELNRSSVYMGGSLQLHFGIWGGRYNRSAEVNSSLGGGGGC